MDKTRKNVIKPYTYYACVIRRILNMSNLTFLKGSQIESYYAPKEITRYAPIIHVEFATKQFIA